MLADKLFYKSFGGLSQEKFQSSCEETREAKKDLEYLTAKPKSSLDYSKSSLDYLKYLVAESVSATGKSVSATKYFLSAINKNHQNARIY